MSWSGRFDLFILQALTVEGLIFAPWALFYSSLSIRATDSLSSSRVSHFAISSRIALRRCLSEAKFFSSIPFYLPKLDIRLFNPGNIEPFPVTVLGTYAPTDRAEIEPAPQSIMCFAGSEASPSLPCVLLIISSGKSQRVTENLCSPRLTEEGKDKSDERDLLLT